MKVSNMKIFKEEKIYVYIALFFGLLFVFFTPPFQSPDEDSHFTRSYLISKGNFYPMTKNKKLGNNIPLEMNNYIQEKLKYIGNRNQKYSFSEMVNDQYNLMNYEKKIFKDYSTSNVIPIAYVAPATGIFFSKIVAKIFNMSSISTSYMLYFGRLFSLIMSIFIVYNAIKITPVFKKTMVAVASIPMFIYLSSMITYDNLLNSLTLLAISIMLKLIYDKSVKSINWKYMLAISIIGVVLLNVKTIYSLIFLLIFFIPKEKFKNKKEKITKFSIMIGIVLLFTILLKLPYLFLKTGATSSLAGKQLAFIFSNPFKYANILYSNIVCQRNFQLTSLIGLFGLIDTYMPIPVIFIYYLYLFLIGLSEGVVNKHKITNKMKIVIIISFILIVTAIYTIMYISWTPVILNGKIGTKDISGVQGRYFIPIIFPLLMTLSSKKIKKLHIFDKICNNYLLIPIISLTISIFVIIVRFWV